MTPRFGDTIAALATARGRAALAIVRASGPEAVSIVDGLFGGADLCQAVSHTAHVGYFSAPDGQRLDQVVVTLFRAPRSATGEDVVEITCHGGDVAPQLVLKALVDAGARLAHPGEFTERAFLNGKVDLAQAEAIAGLIHAQSSLAHRVSLNHLEGRYSDAIGAVREELVRLCALVELELDFSEEDVEFADRGRLEAMLEETEGLLTRLLGSYRLGTLVRDGVRVVIGGRPNAGKSTLLNALVQHDRAIVSPHPGTTRDEVEAEAEIGGLTFRFVDTAGLRETEDLIEAEGVRRTHRAIDRADVLLYVFDASLGLDEEELAWLRRFTVKQSGAEPFRPSALLIANKQDLALAPSTPPGVELPLLPLSAHRALCDADLLRPVHRGLLDETLGDLADTESTTIVMSQRHRQHLSRALDAVREARYTLGHATSGETLALDLRQALAELGAITGAVTNEDVLSAIFSEFCIGK